MSRQCRISAEFTPIGGQERVPWEGVISTGTEAQLRKLQESLKVMQGGGHYNWIRKTGQEGWKSFGVPFLEACRPIVGKTKNRERVWLGGHFHPRNFSDEGIDELYTIAQEKIATLDASDRGIKSYKFEVETGQFSLHRCVKLKPGEKVRYIKRPPRENFTPIVLREKRDMSFTTKAAIIVNRVKTGHLVLATAYFGPITPPEPDTYMFNNLEKGGREKAEKFWREHALVMTPEELRSFRGTEVFPF